MVVKIVEGGGGLEQYEIDKFIKDYVFNIIGSCFF
jgi:hypothetical protein